MNNVFLLAASGLSTILYIGLAILVLLFMILIHELGHYTAGRILKFKINEFSIGFGKAIFSKTNKRGEKISLRIFPIGGYCAFEGENDAGEVTNPAAFNSQKPWKRIIVLFSGAFFNFLSAIIFSFILLVSFGYDVRQIDTVLDTTPNFEVLQAGDVIWEVNGIRVDALFSQTFDQLALEYGEGEVFTLTIKRNGEIKSVDVQKYPTLDEEDKEILMLGITVKTYKFSFIEALARCVPMAAGFAWLVLKSLWLLITFQLPITQIGGPITTISAIATYTQQSIITLFVLLPLISANLAMFNLLPFPALDGSRIVFTGIEWIRRKPIKKKIENWIHTFGLVFLMAFVIIVDILHFVL